MLLISIQSYPFPLFHVNLKGTHLRFKKKKKNKKKNPCCFSWFSLPIHSCFHSLSLFSLIKTKQSLKSSGILADTMPTYYKTLGTCRQSPRTPGACACTNSRTQTRGMQQYKKPTGLRLSLPDFKNCFYRGIRAHMTTPANPKQPQKRARKEIT